MFHKTWDGISQFQKSSVSIWIDIVLLSLMFFSGYMAPEYALQNRFSVKSDVFSFGVLVLEIVTGKKNSWLSNSEELELLLIHVSVLVS